MHKPTRPQCPRPECSIQMGYPYGLSIGVPMLTPFAIISKKKTHPNKRWRKSEGARKGIEKLWDRKAACITKSNEKPAAAHHILQRLDHWHWIQTAKGNRDCDPGKLLAIFPVARNKYNIKSLGECVHTI